ncbi:hypothetical protein Tsubulata_041101 [Turnera subulata]|uniref:DUF4228 domain-containing protein n=1 Tax=Turnera subulata TaxID=218843 RepID=A0A9Q0JBA6_9ROSI|nr:hypothetical protein Tsubulata_048150 [Turnera subulata]KAJ4842500.1 hypothetical protein Tsubulata_041101 [Turnera subulata]
MGNCQAVDAATLVIQHPSGKVENLYWPVSASEVMKMNPGHYVALLLSTTLYPTSTSNNGDYHKVHNHSTNSTTTTNSNSNPLRVTRIKLLRPTDTLALGHCYRLITTQDVMKGILAKKQAKQQKNQSESAGKPERLTDKPGNPEGRRSHTEKSSQVVARTERTQPRTTTSTNPATARPRTWQPSLKSISEAGTARS